MKYGRMMFLLLIPAATFVACGGSAEKFDATGSFETTEVVVSSEASGKILSLDAVEGSEVQKDQAVGRIDTYQLELKRDQLRATVKSVESRRPDIAVQIASLEQQLETARTERCRIEKLLSADAANRKQLDDADAQIALLERQLAAQRTTLSRNDQGILEELESLRIQVKELDDQISKGTIVSPIKGTVLVKYAERGELAVFGKALFKVADMDDVCFRAYVDAASVTRLKLGQDVRVFADFGEKDSREYPGRISWISEKSEFTPKTIQTRNERADLVYAIKVAVKNDGYLKIGMYGRLLFGK